MQKVEQIYKRLRDIEVIRYGFWGVITIVFSLASYYVFELFMPYNIANLVSIILTKILAYLTNRKYVFESRDKGLKQFGEIIRYVLGRGFTGVVDYFGLILLTELIGIDDKIGKILMLIVVTILNYLVGKLMVFKK